MLPSSKKRPTNLGNVCVAAGPRIHSVYQRCQPGSNTFAFRSVASVLLGRLLCPSYARGNGSLAATSFRFCNLRCIAIAIPRIFPILRILVLVSTIEVNRRHSLVELVDACLGQRSSELALVLAWQRRGASPLMTENGGA